MQNSKIRSLVACSALVAIAASPSLAQTAVSRVDLAGEWSGPIALDAGTQTLALVFKITDSTVTGTVYSDGNKFGDMEGATLTGNTVHFKMQSLDFTGVITGTTMKVALIVFNGSTRNLTLKKVPASSGESSTAPRKPPE